MSLQQTYSVVRQAEVAKDRNNCYFGKAPSLDYLNQKYDESAAAAWLIPHLTELAVFSNNSKGMSDAQIKTCADVIAREYGYLKLTELMLFFSDFKAGKYGVFYGSVSPLQITYALRQFCEERKEIRTAYLMQQEAAKRDKDVKRAIKPSDFQKLCDEHKEKGDYDQWVESLKQEYETNKQD